MTREGTTRIVFVHPSDELYGADRILLDMLRALSREDRALAEVWLPTDLDHPSAPLCREVTGLGITVRHLELPILRRAYRRPRALPGLLGRAYRLFRELRRHRPDLVYCTTSAAFLAAPVARRAGVPRVVGHLQELWSPGDGRVLGRLARSCDTLVAISSPVKSVLPTALQARTVVVPNSTPEPQTRVSLEEHRGPLAFVVASRWTSGKGHRTLLRAWDRLPDPGRLVVLGGPPLSGGSVDVGDLASRLRDPDSVEVVGEVADPHPFLEQADVVLVPSDYPEGFGLVAIEAFARGRPVVASGAGGILDIVTDGVDGWLYPPGDDETLSAVLAGLTRERVVRSGARARTTYEAKFTSDRYATAWSEAVGLRAGAADRAEGGRVER